jgi:hypothetical protein
MAHDFNVGFYRFVRPEGHVPDVGLRHVSITRAANEGFVVEV